MDTFAPSAPAGDRDRSKILVMVNSQCFAVEVLDAEGQPHPVKMIEQSLRKVVVDDARLKEGRSLPVGIMSSDDRSTWAKVGSSLIIRTMSC